ncbi:MAG: peptidase S10, partial [Bryobacteraceae bacterium]|nr:peptidase S10 [Bryobacteraceae bacterium]
IQRFTKELLRDKGLTVGRLDGRLTGSSGTATAETPEFDPSMTAIRTPYTALMNQYARTALGWETEEKEYFALGGGITSPWDWGVSGGGPGSFGQGYADTSVNLRSALEKNPYMKVLIASGYYDLATPFHAVEYTVAHMCLPPALRKNFTWTEYEAGHMMYIHVPSLKKLKADVDRFYADSTRP